MNLSQSSTRFQVSHDQVAALGEEIAALVRAGVPLESGLADLATELPGGLGELTRRIATRLRNGETLDAALAEENAQLPATTEAVIRAGLRSGNLASALESHAASARRISKIRTTAGLSLLYPMMVVVVCWTLFWFYVAKLMPGMAQLEEYSGTWQTIMQRLSATADFWGPLGPVLLVAAVIIWWNVSRGGGGADPRMVRSKLGWIPSARKIADWNRQAIFAESLALLIENQVTLGEAVRLAAASAGESNVKAAGLKFVEKLDSGLPPAKAVVGIEGLPPLVVWLFQAAGSTEQLVRGLRHAGETYLERADDLTSWMTISLPMLLTGVFASTIVFCYALAILVPWAQTMLRLTQP